MNIVKIAAFSDDHRGGNPAGVALTKQMPSTTEMQRIAAEVGYSETVFAQMQTDEKSWRVRYFSPESEVPFCGHATIALGAVLAEKYGDNNFHLTLNETEISVQGANHEGQYIAALESPSTRYELLTNKQIEEALALFNYKQNQVSNVIPAARIHGGADHYLFALRSRQDLAAMNYDLDQGREFMKAHDLVTIMFVVAETDKLFHVRNAFASGGVLEDPATGAAAAAFAGYLRDAGNSTKRDLTIIQGEDMEHRSVISAKFSNEAGSSIQVSGATRKLD